MIEQVHLDDWWGWYYGPIAEIYPMPDLYETGIGDSLSINWQNGLLDNDQLIIGQASTELFGGQPANGLVSIELDGSFTYTPNANFVGIDRFWYQVVEADLPAAFVDVVVKSATYVEGDFDGSGEVGSRVDDIDLLSLALQNPQFRDSHIYDLTGDLIVDHSDYEYMIHDVLSVSFGDADVSGTFDSKDLIAVFRPGTFEDNIPNNSTWRTGDWNHDGEFDTGDIIVAFQDGGFSFAAMAQQSNRWLREIAADVLVAQDHEREADKKSRFGRVFLA